MQSSDKLQHFALMILTDTTVAEERAPDDSEGQIVLRWLDWLAQIVQWLQTSTLRIWIFDRIFYFCNHKTCFLPNNMKTTAVFSLYWQNLFYFFLFLSFFSLVSFLLRYIIWEVKKYDYKHVNIKHEQCICLLILCHLDRLGWNVRVE